MYFFLATSASLYFALIAGYIILARLSVAATVLLVRGLSLFFGLLKIDTIAGSFGHGLLSLDGESADIDVRRLLRSF